MPRGLLLLIEHPEKPEQRLAAVWLQDNSPWREALKEAVK